MKYLLIFIAFAGFSQGPQKFSTQEGYEIVKSTELEFKKINENQVFSDSEGNVYKVTIYLNKLTVEIFDQDLNLSNEIILDISADQFPPEIWYKYFRSAQFYEFSDGFGIGITIRNTKQNITSQFLMFFDDDLNQLNTKWEFLKSYSAKSVRARHNVFDTPNGNKKNNSLKNFEIKNDFGICALYEKIVNDKIIKHLVWQNSQGELLCSKNLDFGSVDNGEYINGIFFISENRVGCFSTDMQGINYLKTIDSYGKVVDTELEFDKFHPFSLVQNSPNEFVIIGLNEEFKVQSYFYTLGKKPVEFMGNILSNYYSSDMKGIIKDDVLMVMLNLWQGGFKEGWSKLENSEIGILKFDLKNGTPKLIDDFIISKKQIVESDVDLQKESTFIQFDFIEDRVEFKLKSYSKLLKRSEVPFGKFTYLTTEYNASGVFYRDLIIDLRTLKFVTKKKNENLESEDMRDLIDMLPLSDYSVFKSTTKGENKGKIVLSCKVENYTYYVLKRLYYLPELKDIKLSKYGFKFIGEYRDSNDMLFVLFTAKYGHSGPSGFIIKLPVFLD